MGDADKRAKQLIGRIEDGGAPGGGHLDALVAAAGDVNVKRARRRRAVELIAAIDGDAPLAAASRLTLEPWMNADAQERVAERLWSRGAVEWLIPLLGSGELDERIYADGVERLADVAPSDLLTVLGPYVANPGRADPASLLGLMRVLIASGEDGAAAVAALAADPDADALVRTEALYALERERMDLVPSDDAMEAEEQTLTFHASRLRAESFEQDLRAYAAANDIPYRATIGDGRVWREVAVTVTARPATVADLARYAREIGRFRGDWGGPGVGGPWHSDGDWGGVGDFGGGDFGGGGGGGGDGGGGGGGG